MRSVIRLLVVLLLAGQSFAAIAYVQKKSATTASGTSVAATFTSSNTAGNFIVVVTRNSSGQTTGTPTDTAGNTYLKAVDLNTAANRYMAIYYAMNVASQASNQVTVTNGTSVGNFQVIIAEFSGVATSSALDLTGSAYNAATASPTSTLTGTTAQADELVIGGCTDGVFTYSAGTNSFGALTIIENAMSPNITGTEYQILTSQQTNLTVPFVQTSASASTAVSASFKAAGAAPASKPNRSWIF